MRIGLNLILGLGLLAPGTTWADAPILQGLSENDLKKVKVEVPEAFSGPLSYEEVDEIIRKISQSGSYEKVYAEKKSGQITIYATPTRYISEVLFKGNRHFSRSQLQKISELASDDRFERKRIIDAGEKLKDYYGHNGFFNTIITVNFIKVDDRSLNIEFDIQEMEPCRIINIDIQSENPSLKDRVKLLTLKHLKKPLTTERVAQLQSDLRSFFLNNSYLTTELSDPEVRYNDNKSESSLVFRVIDPFRYEFYLHPLPHDPILSPRDGDRSLLSFTKIELYRAMGLDSQESRSQDPAAEISDRLRQFYFKQGYPAAQITSKTFTDETSFLRKVHLNIVENHKVQIKEMLITGRISRSPSYYRNQLLSGPHPNLQRGLYNRAELDEALESLIVYLKGEGFLQAQVRSFRVEYPEQSSEAKVVIVLDEGPLTEITDIEISGHKAFPSETLVREIGMPIGGPLRLANLDQALARLVRYYQSQGYLEMRVLNEGEDLIKYNDRGTQARLKFVIQEGPLVRVAKVLTEGHVLTKDNVILRAANLKEGMILTPTLIETAETRLTQLGIFSRASLRTLEEGTPIADRTVVISVTERDPGTFRLGFGVNNERGLTLRGFTVYSYDNLWGTARSLTARAEAKSHVVVVDYPQYEVAASYLEPFLFGTQTRGRINISSSSRVFEYKTSDDVTKIQESDRIDLLAERFFNRNTRLTWKIWGIDGREEFERYGRCIQNGFVPNSSCPPISLQIATAGPTLDIDYTDNRLLPTKGFYTTWNLDYSSPSLGSSSLVEFVKTEFTFTKFWQLAGPKLIWANSIRGGYISNLSKLSGSGVPTSHAFFLGGPFTVRGFNLTSDADRIPNQRQLPVTRGNELLIDQDSHLALLKSELRFSLMGELGGVIFYDGGMVQVTGRTFDRPWRDAVGVGLRYNTPVGPLAIDVGWKINPITDIDPKESPYVIHFSFGTF